MNHTEPNEPGYVAGLPSVWPFPGKRWLWPGLAGVAVLAVLVWAVLANIGSGTNMVVVFEGRTFDTTSRRQALATLAQQGIGHKLGAEGEILVAPEVLVQAQAALEKAGLKPTTLEELRTVNEGPLAILESPAQRDDRRRAAKERELAWLVKRFDNVAQAHVTIEPAAGTHRWIGSGEKARQRVRIFIEPARANESLSAETVSLIEKQVLTTLPTTGPGLVSIHDSKHIYLMAGTPAEVATATAKPLDTEASEEQLAERIRTTVNGLENAIVRVSLRQVDETPTLKAQPIDDDQKAPAKIASKLVLNQPIAIELEPAETKNQPIAAPAKTLRANVQIQMKSELSADLRTKARETITTLISPVLLEQFDIQHPPAAALAEITAKTAPMVATATNTNVAKQHEPEIQSLNESSGLPLTPWIFGGVLLAFVAGGTVLLKSTRNAGRGADMNWPADEKAQQWVRDLAAAVTPPEPHLVNHAEQADTDTDAAAQLLSGWITDNHETSA